MVCVPVRVCGDSSVTRKYTGMSRRTTHPVGGVTGAATRQRGTVPNLASLRLNAPAPPRSASTGPTADGRRRRGIVVESSEDEEDRDEEMPQAPPSSDPAQRNESGNQPDRAAVQDGVEVAQEHARALKRKKEEYAAAKAAADEAEAAANQATKRARQAVVDQTKANQADKLAEQNLAREKSEVERAGEESTRAEEVLKQAAFIDLGTLEMARGREEAERARKKLAEETLDVQEATTKAKEAREAAQREAKEAKEAVATQKSRVNEAERLVRETEKLAKEKEKLEAKEAKDKAKAEAKEAKDKEAKEAKEAKDKEKAEAKEAKDKEKAEAKEEAQRVATEAKEKVRVAKENEKVAKENEKLAKSEKLAAEKKQREREAERIKAEKEAQKAREEARQLCQEQEEQIHQLRWQLRQAANDYDVMLIEWQKNNCDEILHGENEQPVWMRRLRDMIYEMQQQIQGAEEANPDEWQVADGQRHTEWADKFDNEEEGGDGGEEGGEGEGEGEEGGASGSRGGVGAILDDSQRGDGGYDDSEWDGLVNDDIVLEFAIRVVNDTDDDPAQLGWREEIVDILTFNRTPIQVEREDLEDKSLTSGYDELNPSKPGVKRVLMANPQPKPMPENVPEWFQKKLALEGPNIQRGVRDLLVKGPVPLPTDVLDSVYAYARSKTDQTPLITQTNNDDVAPNATLTEWSVSFTIADGYGVPQAGDVARQLVDYMRNVQPDAWSQYTKLNVSKVTFASFFAASEPRSNGKPTSEEMEYIYKSQPGLDWASLTPARRQEFVDGARDALELVQLIEEINPDQPFEDLGTEEQERMISAARTVMRDRRFKESMIKHVPEEDRRGVLDSSNESRQLLEDYSR